MLRSSQFTRGNSREGRRKVTVTWVLDGKIVDPKYSANEEPGEEPVAGKMVHPKDSASEGLGEEPECWVQLHRVCLLIRHRLLQS